VYSHGSSTIHAFKVPKSERTADSELSPKIHCFIFATFWMFSPKIPNKPTLVKDSASFSHSNFIWPQILFILHATYPSYSLFTFFFFWGTGVWTRGLAVSRQALKHLATSPAITYSSLFPLTLV
jgi:hypothetical protein